MTPVILAGLVGTGLSLIFFYVPGLNTSYAALDDGPKRLIMLALLSLASAVVLGLSCVPGANILPAEWAVTCDQSGVIELVKIFGSAVAGNVATFVVSPRTAAVKVANARSGT